MRVAPREITTSHFVGRKFNRLTSLVRSDKRPIRLLKISCRQVYITDSVDWTFSGSDQPPIEKYFNENSIACCTTPATSAINLSSKISQSSQYRALISREKGFPANWV